jgi:hypothetical protein
MSTLKAFCIFSTALFLISPVMTSAEDAHGDQFVTTMDGNTLSGTNAAGFAFNLYFLAGGQVTYSNIAGQKSEGAWYLNRNGDVCIQWPRRVEAIAGCFQMSIDGDRIIWRSGETRGAGVLRGSVTNTFVKRAR